MAAGDETVSLIDGNRSGEHRQSPAPHHTPHHGAPHAAALEVYATRYWILLSFSLIGAAHALHICTRAHCGVRTALAAARAARYCGCEQEASGGMSPEKNLSCRESLVYDGMYSWRRFSARNTWAWLKWPGGSAWWW